ncbi:MAG: DNA recombination/repair protein RecA, partial [Phycisphaerales bacterium]|nr:DNA recombination/repair protein RecA [Phycisphaerales bacterium]
AIKQGDKMLGNRTRVKVVKNKLAPPFREVEFDIMYGEGISTQGDLLDLAVEQGVATKQGAWFSYGEVRLGQGRENSKNFLVENPDIAAEFKEKILAILAPDEEEAPPAEAEEAAAEGTEEGAEE